MRTIFVSSTFKDMQAERDAIRDIVAPGINEKAYQHGDRIDFCDLRWGVNTQEMDSDSSAKRVLDVCFHEIDRSSPPMIIFLGDRYGWIPDSAIVSETEVYQELQLEALEKSVTALEIEYGTILRKRKAFVYMRRIIGDNIPSIYLVESDRNRARLDALKARIKELPNCVVTFYDLHINVGVIDKEDIVSLSDKIIRDLESACSSYWAEYDNLSPFDREISHQWLKIQVMLKMQR